MPFSMHYDQELCKKGQQYCQIWLDLTEHNSKDPSDDTEERRIAVKKLFSLLSSRDTAYLQHLQQIMSRADKVNCPWWIYQASIIILDVIDCILRRELCYRYNMLLPRGTDI